MNDIGYFNELVGVRAFPENVVVSTPERAKPTGL